MRHQWLVWPIVAALLGFALGGSIAWGIMYSPPQQHTADNHQADEHSAEKEGKNGFWEKTTDDPVAYFNLWLVAFTGILAISTIGLWIVTWQSGKRQSKDMTESIDVAERAIVAGERAWIRIEIGIGGDLKFDAAGMNLRLNYKVINCGNSPATGVRVFSDLRLQRPGKPEALEIYRRYCANVRSRGEKAPAVDFKSYTLFPNEQKIIPTNHYIPLEKIEETKTEWEAITKDPMPFFDLLLVGCAAYRIPFDDRQHQTGFLADVRRRVNLGAGETGFSSFTYAERIVPFRDISVIDSVWGSASID